MNDNTKVVLDLGAIGITVATVVQWLPSVAAILSIIWTLLRIYDWIKGKIEPQ